MDKVNYIKTCLIFIFTTYTFDAIGQDNLKESSERGKSLYTTHCVVCHMANGEGITGAFPPLAKSDYLMSDTKRSIKNILNGINGEIKVNNVSYYGAMLGFTLKDQEVADILNYIRNNWGNKGDIIDVKTVAEARK